MKKLLTILIAACFCMIPVTVFAGNAMPYLYLEIYTTDAEFDPLPDYVCVDAKPLTGALPCFAVRYPYNFAYMPLHVGALDGPICTTTGPACESFGGYLGVPFGVQQVAANLTTFMSWNACPGFLKGPSGAGEPAACLASSFSGCHDWWDHLGYVIYLNMSTKTTDARFNVVASADVAHYKVINCANLYDNNTQIGGGAQWGPTQTIVCPLAGPTSVELTTWGKIKGLYR